MNHTYRYLMETRFNTDRLEELRCSERGQHPLVDLSDFETPTVVGATAYLMIPALILTGSCLVISTLI